MYREFFLLIKSYISVIEKEVIFFEAITPLIIASFFTYYVGCLSESMLSTIVSMMAIILGFVIASITILLTSGSDNILKAKEHMTKKSFMGKELNLFRILLIIFFYMALISLIELIIGSSTLILKIGDIKIFIFINIFLVFHLIFIGIRNITNLFLIEFR